MKKVILKLAIILLCLLSLCSCFNKNEETIPSYTDDSKLNGKDFGCMSGSVFDQNITRNYPDSKIVYFNSRAELLLGLKSGKVECYLADEPVAKIFKHDNQDITYIRPIIRENFLYGFCFSKESLDIRDQFNLFFEDIKKEGLVEIYREKWMCEDAMSKTVAEVDLPNINGEIRACTTPDAAPFSFFKNNKYEGYEVELLTEFCRRNGYALKIEGTSFDALLSSIASGKFDIAFNGIYITEERKKTVDYSIPLYEAEYVVLVRNNITQNTSFFENLIYKIRNTFIVENRWKLIIDGIITTLIITIFSLFFGTLAGFIVYQLTGRLGQWFTKTVEFVAYIVSGLPVIVLLMILFYIIFSKSTLSGTAISIIGFSLIECCSVYGMLKTGISAIDKGQAEGALALGYTEHQTLFKFILPQALRIIMPSYRLEIVSLIKSSSIVGYVTVQDITRVSDIIRSRTYDAFFPLIVTAIIYFIMAYFLTKIVDYLQQKYLSNEKTKEEILKSVGK